MGEDGKEVEIEVAECNNSVVFPGIGLGAVLSRTRLVTDKMLVAAVEAVAGMGPVLKDKTAPLLPGVDVVRDVSVRVARKVIQAAVAEGVATERLSQRTWTSWMLGFGNRCGNFSNRPLKKVEMEGASRQARGELRVVGSLRTRGTF